MPIDIEFIQSLNALNCSVTSLAFIKVVCNHLFFITAFIYKSEPFEHREDTALYVLSSNRYRHTIPSLKIAGIVTK